MGFRRALSRTVAAAQCHPKVVRVGDMELSLESCKDISLQETRRARREQKGLLGNWVGSNRSVLRERSE